MYSSTHSLISALDGGEWSASRPGRFTPRERAPGTHWIVVVGLLMSPLSTFSGLQKCSYELDVRGSFTGRGRDFSLRHRVYTDSGAHPASYPMDTAVFSQEVNRLGREADR
jgi:hypothetical protein